MKFDFTDEHDFEKQVRNVARAIWGSQSYGGSIVVSGLERDAIIENDTNIFCLEITVSKRREKAEKDCKKLDELVRRLRGLHPDKGVTGWFITRFEATGEQGSVLTKYRTIKHETFEQFYARLINSAEYLQLRLMKPFGSVRDPIDDHFEGKIQYIPTKITNIDNNANTYAKRIATSISSRPHCAVILGEYGVGKSMALREIFHVLAQEHRGGRDSQFPVYINLREHVEQYEPDECLRRHAGSLGLSNPETLVKAWRAGYVHLLLDGFDELAPRIATRARQRARDLRRSALSLVRRFSEETPRQSSILLAGRNNYFDDNEELFDAAGITKSWSKFEINELDDSDFDRYVKMHDQSLSLPRWVPRKPLLLSYIIHHPNLSADLGHSLSPIEGWGYLIDKICEREVRQVYVALEPYELREIYGRMATKARRKQDIRGPLTFDDCKSAFSEITGVEPEERSITALLRLPGTSGASRVGISDGLERGTRWFVDEEFSGALCATDLRKLIVDPSKFDVSCLAGCKLPLRELSVDMAISEFKEIDLVNSVNYALRVVSTARCAEACADLFAVVLRADVPIYSSICIEGLELGEVRLEGEMSLGHLEIKDFYFEKLVIDVGKRHIHTLPYFSAGAIESLEYAETLQDIVNERFSQDTLIERANTFSIDFYQLRDSELPEKFVDLASIIDKVFIQSKSGRQLNALYRGRPDNRRQALSQII